MSIPALFSASPVSGKANARIGHNVGSSGAEFNVPGNSSFDIRAIDVVDYCCSFL